VYLKNTAAFQCDCLREAGEAAEQDQKGSLDRESKHPDMEGAGGRLVSGVKEKDT
jgi:hypothetical protein